MNKGASLGILLVRLALGIIFIAHGYVKLFVYGIGGVVHSFASMGIPVPAVAGTIVTLLEFFGGIAILLGLLTRWVSILFVIEFIVAILKVHLQNGFFIGPGTDGKFHYGFEFAFLILFTSLALSITKAGDYSLDYILFEKGNKSE